MPYAGTHSHREMLQHALKLLRQNGHTMEEIAERTRQYGGPVSRSYVNLIATANLNAKRRWSFSHVAAVFSCLEMEPDFSTHIMNNARLNPGARDDSYYFLAAYRYFRSTDNRDYATLGGLLGTYAMFRPIWSSPIPDLFVRSIVNVDKSGDALTFTETQSYTDPQHVRVNEVSMGYILTFGSMIFIITKEEDGKCLRFVTINELSSPLTRRVSSVDVFKGEIKSISPDNSGPPTQRFVCRRVQNGDTISNIVRVSDLLSDDQKFFGVSDREVIKQKGTRSATKRRTMSRYSREKGDSTGV